MMLIKLAAKPMYDVIREKLRKVPHNGYDLSENFSQI